MASGPASGISDMQTNLQILRGNTVNHLYHQSHEMFEMKGITLADFESKHSSAGFDMATIRRDFGTHCPDFNVEAFADGQKYKCIEFCSYILYQIGPESRRIQRAQGDKTWIFKFDNGPVDNAKNEYEESNGVVKGVHQVTVSTWKVDNKGYRYENSVSIQKLSMKAAGLLAVDILRKIIIAKSIEIFTPLAGACFSKQDIENIASIVGKSKEDCYIAINASAQSGGQHLEYSDANLAAVCVMSATRMMDVKDRVDFTTKIVKQYIAAKKVPKVATIMELVPFAAGGVPSALKAEVLIQKFDAAHEAAINRAQVASIMQQADIKSLGGTSSASKK